MSVNSLSEDAAVALFYRVKHILEHFNRCKKVYFSFIQILFIISFFNFLHLYRICFTKMCPFLGRSLIQRRIKVERNLLIGIFFVEMCPSQVGMIIFHFVENFLYLYLKGLSTNTGVRVLIIFLQRWQCLEPFQIGWGWGVVALTSKKIRKFYTRKITCKIREIYSQSTSLLIMHLKTVLICCRSQISRGLGIIFFKNDFIFYEYLCSKT